MIRRTMIAVLLVCFVSTSPALAGTWKDDFEDGFVDWRGVDHCWTVEDGECSGRFLNAPAGSYQTILVGDVEWTDYTVNCKMKFTGNRTPGGYAGMSFRNAGMMGHAFAIDAPSGTAKGWASTTNVSKVPLPFALSKDTWYELKIIVEGDHFEFYIDGKRAGKFVDDSIPSGCVGLEVRNVHAHFDDVIISGDDVEDGGNWEPAEHPGEAVVVKSDNRLVTTWASVRSEY
jgi:hypothetical protein